MICTELKHIRDQIEESERNKGYAAEQRQDIASESVEAQASIKQSTKRKEHRNYFQCPKRQFVPAFTYRFFHLFRACCHQHGIRHEEISFGFSSPSYSQWFSVSVSVSFLPYRFSLYAILYYCKHNSQLQNRGKPKGFQVRFRDRE